MAKALRRVVLVGASCLFVVAGCGRATNPHDVKSGVGKQISAGAGDKPAAKPSTLDDDIEDEGIASRQAEAGDIAVAEATAARIHDPWRRGWVEADIVQALCKAKDIPNAKARAAAIEDDSGRSLAYQKLATAQLDAGDKVGARESLKLAKASVKKVRDGETVMNWCQRIAIAQAKAGDFAEAKETASHMVGGYAVWANIGIAQAQAKAGDKTGARETLRTARTVVFSNHFSEASEYPQSDYLESIAALQRKLGDIKEAKATEADIHRLEKKRQ